VESSVAYLTRVIHGEKVDPMGVAKPAGAGDAAKADAKHEGDHAGGGH